MRTYQFVPNRPSTPPLLSGLPGQRKRADPLLDLAPQLHNLGLVVSLAHVLQEGLDARRVLASLRRLRLDGLLVEPLRDGDGPVDNVCDAGEVLGLEAAGRHGGGADAETAWLKSRHVTRHGILVGRNADEFEDALDASAVHALGLQVDEDKMVVGSAGDDAVTETTLLLWITKTLRESLGVQKDVLLVCLELWALGLLQRNGESSDGVVVRATLVAWEHGRVYTVLEVVHLLLLSLGVDLANPLTEKDHGASWPTERLVRGRGDDIGEWEGRWDDSGSDEARNMGHVTEEIRSSLVCDFAETLVVEESGVSGCACNNELWSVEHSELLQLHVVDQPRLLVQAVWKSLEVFRNGRDLLRRRLITVGQMPTVGQVETHNPIMNIENSGIRIQVGGRARERLDIDAPFCRVQTKRLQCSVLAQYLGLVDELVATVVSCTWVTFGIFVFGNRSV